MSASCYDITEVSVETIYINKHISNLDQNKVCEQLSTWWLMTDFNNSDGSTTDIIKAYVA